MFLFSGLCVDAAPHIVKLGELQRREMTVTVQGMSDVLSHAKFLLASVRSKGEPQSLSVQSDRDVG